MFHIETYFELKYRMSIARLNMFYNKALFEKIRLRNYKSFVIMNKNKRE